MKTAFLIVFLLLTLAAVSYSQDNKANPQRNAQEITYTIREAVCPDCQGWGWLLSKGYNFGVNKPRSSSTEALNQTTIRQSTMDMQLVKSPCYLCFGKGYVHVKEPKK